MVVHYPCLINGKVEERWGIFDVFFGADGLPVRAEMSRFVGYENPAQLVEFWDGVERAIMDLQTMHCQNVLDLDAQEWDGTLSFEPDAVLI